MDCGLLGLPGSGKTTLFAALTGVDSNHLHAGDMKPHLGVADIPDPRLEQIARYIPPQKIVPATLRLVDIPGVPPGSDPKKLNSFLEHVRQVDAIAHVVRCFDDGSGVKPAGDIERMETELVLADLVVAESARDRAARPARAGEAEAKARLAVLEKVVPVLEDGRPCRSVERLNDNEAALLRSYGMITFKPTLYIANIDESHLGEESGPAKALFDHAGSIGAEAVAVCAKLEAELAELEDADRQEMLTSLGLEEPAIGPLARAAHRTLGLTSFYTAGPKEVRAWAVPVGATAPEAAGAIHTDLQRGFIRAECYNIADLLEHKSEKAIREAGKMRSEGKGYQLQDGDVVHILFNV